MATITYGKGKILQPTSLKALRAAIDQNVQDGRVEMPVEEARTVDKEVRNGFVRVTIAPANVRLYRARRSKGSMENKGAKVDKVEVNAPGLANFFVSGKKKTYSY
jgi:hypothetical protein